MGFPVRGFTTYSPGKSVSKVCGSGALAYFLGVEVLLAVCVFLEQFPRTVAEEFVISDLQFKGARVPRIIEFNIIGMDESQFFICNVPIWSLVRNDRQY